MLKNRLEKKRQVVRSTIMSRFNPVLTARSSYFRRAKSEQTDFDMAAAEPALEQSSDDCSLCRDSLHAEDMTVLPCGHPYHMRCIKASMQSWGASCPLCLRDLPIAAIYCGKNGGDERIEAFALKRAYLQLPDTEKLRQHVRDQLISEANEAAGGGEDGGASSSSASGRLVALKHELDEERKRSEALRTDAESAARAIETLTEQRQLASERNKTLKSEVDRLNGKNGELKADLSQAYATNRKNHDALIQGKKDKAELDGLRERLRETECRLSEKSAELDARLFQLGSVTEERDDLRKRCLDEQERAARAERIAMKMEGELTKSRRRHKLQQLSGDSGTLRAATNGLSGQQAPMPGAVDPASFSSAAGGVHAPSDPADGVDRDMEAFFGMRKEEVHASDYANGGSSHANRDDDSRDENGGGGSNGGELPPARAPRGRDAASEPAFPSAFGVGGGSWGGGPFTFGTRNMGNGRLGKGSLPAGNAAVMESYVQPDDRVSLHASSSDEAVGARAAVGPATASSSGAPKQAAGPRSAAAPAPPARFSMPRNGASSSAGGPRGLDADVDASELEEADEENAPPPPPPARPFLTVPRRLGVAASSGSLQLPAAPPSVKPAGAGTTKPGRRNNSGVFGGLGAAPIGSVSALPGSPPHSSLGAGLQPGTAGAGPRVVEFPYPVLPPAGQSQPVKRPRAAGSSQDEEEDNQPLQKRRAVTSSLSATSVLALSSRVTGASAPVAASLVVASSSSSSSSAIAVGFDYATQTQSSQSGPVACADREMGASLGGHVPGWSAHALGGRRPSGKTPGSSLPGFTSARDLHRPGERTTVKDGSAGAARTRTSLTSQT